MRISIDELTIDGVTCTEAEVSVAISSSVAVRIVPGATIDGVWTEFPSHAGSLVGTPEDVPELIALMEAVASTLFTAVSDVRKKREVFVPIPAPEVLPTEPEKTKEELLEEAYAALITAKEAYAAVTDAVVKEK